jgi:hypothetical protein
MPIDRVAAKDVQERAVEAGLIGEGAQIGKAKVFRDAKASLGVITRQQSGKKSGGWFWALPDATGLAT